MQNEKRSINALLFSFLLLESLYGKTHGIDRNIKLAVIYPSLCEGTAVQVYF